MMARSDKARNIYITAFLRGAQTQRSYRLTESITQNPLPEAIKECLKLGLSNGSRI